MATKDRRAMDEFQAKVREHFPRLFRIKQRPTRIPASIEFRSITDVLILLTSVAAFGVAILVGPFAIYRCEPLNQLRRGMARMRREWLEDRIIPPEPWPEEEEPVPWPTT